MPVAVLVTPPEASADDLRAELAAGGFTVAAVPPTTPEVPPAAVAVVVGTEPVAAALDFVRRARSNGNVQVLWLSVPELMSAGLEAGATASLPLGCPGDVVLTQIRVLTGLAEQFAELAGLADDARQRSRELQAAHEEIGRGIELARRVHRLLTPGRLPEVGPIRLAIHQQPSPRTSGPIFDAARIGETQVVFWLAVPGGSAMSGALLGVVIRHATSQCRPPADPSEVLGRVNRALLEIGLDPPPMVGMACGLMDAKSGEVRVSRGGLPPPLRVPADGPAEPWTWPGPFLGPFDADFPSQMTVLHPGDRLILRTAVPPADADPLPPAAVRHRPLPLSEYAAAVARDADLLNPDGEGQSLLVVGYAADPVQGR